MQPPEAVRLLRATKGECLCWFGSWCLSRHEIAPSAHSCTYKPTRRLHAQQWAPRSTAVNTAGGRALAYPPVPFFASLTSRSSTPAEPSSSCT